MHLKKNKKRKKQTLEINTTMKTVWRLSDLLPTGTGPFMNHQLQKLRNIFKISWKPFFFFFFFLLSYWDTCLFFNTILQQVNWKPPLHSDWFWHVLVTLKLFSCQLKNSVCRLQNEIHSWNVPVTHWSGVSQRDYPWKQKEHRSVQRYCSVP